MEAGALCELHHPRVASDENGGDASEFEGTTSNKTTSADTSTYATADFTDPVSGVWPTELHERVQWMGRSGESGKLPFAPWACQDHPDADPDEDARWKWGLTENYVDGDTVAIAEEDPRLDGRVFLQQADDPYAFVDGDDVRCPDTGEPHPVFIEILNRLGLTYADISTSGTGVHANYKGSLPEGVKQATFAIDSEPWGANDDVPEVEIYDGKHVCVATGEHVPGTPTEIREWDDGELRAILDEYDQLPTRRENVRDEWESFDATEYDPGVTDADETTDEIRDIFHALDRIDARRVAGDTIVHRWNDDASTSGENRAFVPTWGRNANGTANIVNGHIWQDTGGGGYGGPVVMALIDLGELRPDTATPRDAKGELWFTGVSRLRDLGYAIPEYVPASDDGEPVAVLPNSDSLAAPVTGWDWRHAGQRAAQDTDPMRDARRRTTEAITDAFHSSDRVLLEALPTLGKSYGTIKAAAETGEPISVFTGRGRKEQYEQIRDWCDEHGLSHYTLPAFTRDCDTANGEYGAEWEETVRNWYNRGATPKDIHAFAESELGRPLPCQEHEGQRCPYASKWDFDPESFDVLIGHYAHAHKSKVTQGRTVVFDEFPGDTYETKLGPRLEDAVTNYLQREDGLPFSDYTELIERRDDQQRRADALAVLQDEGIDAEGRYVFGERSAHAAAPLAVFTIIAGAENSLGNGWEYTEFPDSERIGLFNREQGYICVLSPPALDYTRGIVALDGTPTKRMWKLSLGERRLNHRQILSKAERKEYIQDGLNLNIVRTSEYVKPYNSADHVNVAGDGALLEGIHRQHGQRPALITTSTAEGEYNQVGTLEHVDGVKHYGNVLGSNEFKECRLGVVIGSNHFGDGFIKKWGAYAGECVERADISEAGKGSKLSYGPFGDDVLTHMREHETLQAIMRFGRDGNGAVVYVHTDTLPEWVPLAGEGRVVDTWSDGMHQVVDAAAELGEWRTVDLVEHPDVEIGERQVRDHLTTLVEKGVLSRVTEGRGFVWRDDGLHRIGEHGDVELDPIELQDPSSAETAEPVRSSIYTWKFRNTELASGRDDCVHPQNETEQADMTKNPFRLRGTTNLGPD